MILLTGGSGLLGRELRKLIPQVFAPSHHEMDITRPLQRYECDLVIHSAAYTDVVGAEKDIKPCWITNVMGTQNLVHTYHDVPFVFISSEYAKKPTNAYARSKAEGEKVVKFEHPNYLIIRTLFKPRPFPFPKAFRDQYTQGDYVDVIAPLVVDEIKKWDKIKSKTVYLGTGRKTIYDLAKQTRDVEPISVDEIKDVVIPKDYV